MTGKDRDFGLGTSLALTLGSALLWGVAHLAAHRHRTGLALMAAHVFLLAFILTMATVFSTHLLSLAVQPRWITALVVTLTVLAATWTAVIVRSYTLVRPAGCGIAGRALTTGLTIGLCALVLAPTAYAARLAYLSRDVMHHLFAGNAGPPVMSEDPWNGAQRVSFLLVGADSAPSRPGVRTDSMTVASVDTATGATTLFGLPRNLEDVPLPSGPARDRFPYGFTGTGETHPGLLNEVFQYAEDHPEVVPRAAKGQRGSTLLKETIGGILGIPVSYYAMIDMRGFAEIIDAMGGVRVTVDEPIVYGRYREGLLPAGTRRLNGEEALWYGRSRTDSDDYVRMGRQKCLLNAVAKQADPVTVVNSFENLATATKRAISTDIPQSLLPALVELSQKVKDTHIRSLSFVPPLINTAAPDWRLIRQKVSQVLAERPIRTAATAPRPTSTTPERPVALDATCR
ncbi:LCP family protein [Nonomuraea glycinis]|uniref:LCP family protein n=1 Tax=Nonomuraea glycinis TaxID=2047744 RepID=UPI002E124B84|nr:LCP family protein [Nonomuraea glycinis]